MQVRATFSKQLIQDLKAVQYGQPDSPGPRIDPARALTDMLYPYVEYFIRSQCSDNDPVYKQRHEQDIFNVAIRWWNDYHPDNVDNDPTPIHIHNKDKNA